MGRFTGFIVFFIAAYAVNIVYPKAAKLVVGLCIGAFVGHSQCFILRWHLVLSPQWGLACATGLGIPFIAEVLRNGWGVKLSGRFHRQFFSRMLMVL